MADSTKRQDREVASTAKQDKKGFKVPRIPGDIMLYPLLVGLLLNSFCPQVLAVGSFTTAVVKGSSTIVGLLLIFMGASINLRAIPEALKTGVVVLVPKLALSIAFGLGVAAFWGNNFFGLSALSIIGGIAFCNVALYSGIMTELRRLRRAGSNGASRPYRRPNHHHACPWSFRPCRHQTFGIRGNAAAFGIGHHHGKRKPVFEKPVGSRHQPLHCGRGLFSWLRHEP